MTTITVSEARTEYGEHLRARNLARSTVKTRLSTITAIVEVIGDIQVKNVTANHMDTLFATKHWQASTSNQRLSHLRMFFEFCRARRYASRDFDPLLGWRNTKPEDKPRTRIPFEEWPALFGACVHPTETIALGTGLFLFLRGSEQRLIQMKHIDLADMEITVYRQKTKQWDTMPISAELDRILRDYLTWYATQLDRPIGPDDYLIPARNKDLDQDPVTGRLIAGSGTINPSKSVGKPHLAIQRVLGRLGYPTDWEGEHTMRRSGARAYFDVLVDQGYDGALRRVQAMLGHKHSKETEGYLGLDLDRQQRNDAIKGQPMFPNLPTGDVVNVRAVG